MIAKPLPLVTAEDFRLGQLPLTPYFCMQLFCLETQLWNHRWWNKTFFFQSFLSIVLWMKKVATGMLGVYSLTENLVAFIQGLVKDAIHIISIYCVFHTCRSCSVPTVFQAVLKNKYAAQTEPLLTSELLPFVLQNKGVVFWCFVNNDAHTKYLFTPTRTVPNDWFSYQNAYQMLLISKFWRNYPVSESAIKLKGYRDLCEIY